MKKIFLTLVASFSIILSLHAQWTGINPWPYLYNGGNVGIGTTTPSKLLQISDNVGSNNLLSLNNTR